jgi:predicted short-subunit dehydrogenase-like oxidoreductase (DUF2520 family)
MKIVIIGAGNTATVLGRKMCKSGHEILQVFSRGELHAGILAAELDCPYTTALEDINKSADFYLVAIPDDAIGELAQRLTLTHKLVTHTAGSVPMRVLEKISRNHGVLYPLQSLRKEIKEIPALPLLVDGSTEDNLTLIQDFAASLSDNVQFADDLSRLKLHLAATFLNNFTNHLFALVAFYCEKEHLSFNLLLPLIKETVLRLQSQEPAKLQTGPAIRNDRKTIESHYEQLADYPELKSLYEEFTKNIYRFHTIGG